MVLHVMIDDDRAALSEAAVKQGMLAFGFTPQNHPLPPTTPCTNFALQ